MGGLGSRERSGHTLPRSTGRPRGALVILLAVVTVAAVSSLRFAGATAVAVQVGDLHELAVAPGYTVEVDSSGFDLPTAIAFIPEPGAAADSPLYFVAELQGTIKVVTRDRTVHDFARVPTWGHQGHDLEGASQQGLAGLCLEPSNGYLFATYTEPDEGGVLRNRVVRFESVPVVYGLAAASATPIAPILASVQSAPAHQIGSCTVHEGELYVGVGDGGNPREVANPDVLLGKIICMSLDGSPCRERAFSDAAAAATVADSGTATAADYVYATGFRNPFGLTWLDGDLKVIENGIKLDRFLTARQGRDHLWNGTDESIASLAEIILPRPFAPVQLDHVPAGAAYMEPGWRGHFVAAGFGSKSVPSGIAMLGGGAEANKAGTPPRYLIEYTGPEGTQHFAGVATGPDGIYAVPMLPIAGTSGAVLRLSYDPQAAHPVVVDKASGLFRGNDMPHLSALGCTSCHTVAGQGGDIGPNLDQFGVEWRITEFLASAEYEALLSAQIAAARGAAGSSDPDSIDALRRVLGASGIDRTWTWLGFMLQDPDFDGVDRQMPALGLTSAEADAARGELFAVLGLSRTPDLIGRSLRAVTEQWRAVLAGAIAGAIALTALLILAEFLWQRRKARRELIDHAELAQRKATSVERTSV
jgi:hypothetical protein